MQTGFGASSGGLEMLREAAPSTAIRMITATATAWGARKGDPSAIRLSGSWGATFGDIFCGNPLSERMVMGTQISDFHNASSKGFSRLVSLFWAGGEGGVSCPLQCKPLDPPRKNSNRSGVLQNNHFRGPKSRPLRQQQRSPLLSNAPNKLPVFG